MEVPNLADIILALDILPPVPIYLKQWVHGESPISTWPVVTGWLVGYLGVIFGIREIMKPYKPLKLNGLFQIHNLFLVTVSALVLVLMLEEILPHWYKHGFFSAICNTTAWTPRMEFYYIVNYYIKYVELIDTVFLVLKKKPLAFLHVFHHAATALLCFTQLEGRTSVSWVVISINLAVHVLMYYYYYATAGGAKIWWKKYLTTFQIVQFVIDLFVVYFATYSYFAATRWDAPSLGTCAGTEGAALFGCGLLTSYLFLFISFYINTYTKKGAKKAKGQHKTLRERINGSANGHVLDALANGKDPSVLDKVN
ncbi:GNS1/SUR4 membrane protein [Dacryopinax primogenitus]|uniref:Elongation of fatty acids protein n=1 Tax=Dacryopinax primogenitus (strain DJM 731) TaxID=1858805 RepID=M5G1D8_DACPD|nr:GNS1/SUR4 membrane protein [Dacryopinax primogenitus]EJU02010.1 GNS1/SUR4 membrane protein [Dacryopinax primogenitus]